MPLTEFQLRKILDVAVFDRCVQSIDSNKGRYKERASVYALSVNTYTPTASLNLVRTVFIVMITLKNFELKFTDTTLFVIVSCERFQLKFIQHL